MIEHNVTAAGKIYDTIRMTDLGLLVGLEASRTEKIVAKMITEDRLKAKIDQTGMLRVWWNSGDRDRENVINYGGESDGWRE
jgi:COP9 signalosome complex subunit 4